MMLANNFPSDLDLSGQTITFDENTEFKSYVKGVDTIADITAETSLEVRGYNTGAGSFYATQIVVNKAVTSTQDILRVRGIIDTLSFSSFRVGKLNVFFDNHTTFVNLEGNVILPGMAVVMVGAFEDEKTPNDIDTNKTDTNRVFHATSIEVLNLDDLEGDHVEVEGFIGASGVSDEKFSIDDMTIQITSVTVTRHGNLSELSAGVRVEVSGIIDRQGVLIAENIDIEQQHEYSLTGPIEAIDTSENSFTVMGTKILIADDYDKNNSSNSAVLHEFTIAGLAIHKFININFHKNSDTGEYVLESVESNVPPDGIAKVKGPISSVYNHENKMVIILAGVKVRFALAQIDSRVTELKPGLIVELSGRYCTAEAVFHVNDYIIRGVLTDDIKT